MNACEPQREYAWFVASVQDSEAAVSLEAAIDQAFEEMPETFVIKRYLEAHKSEVKEMLTTEYNEKKQMELFFEDGIQAGKRETEKQYNKLINLFFDANRYQDVNLAANDPIYRKKLFEEFQIA